MSNDLTFSFRAREVEAIIRALDECGANGQPRVALERFRDQDLAKAAVSARRVLLGKQQHQNVTTPEPIREILKPDPAAGLREAYRDLKDDHMELLGATIDLIKDLPAALDHAEHYRPQEAASLLKVILARVRYSSDQIAHKLHDLENEKAAP